METIASAPSPRLFCFLNSPHKLCHHQKPPSIPKFIHEQDTEQTIRSKGWTRAPLNADGFVTTARTK
jgi:hypothetical protein